MSRIDDLIQDLCPEGVPFQALGTLGRRNKGTSMTAARMREIDTGGPIRVFAGGNTVADVDETSVPVKAVVREPSVIVKSRGHIGFTYYEGPFSHKSELWSYSLSDPIVNQKFVYYYLLTRTPNLQDLARATSVKLPQLSVRDTDALKVPVPPLEVQDEIVRILDTFSALTAELEAELEARRTQYEHYRATLLSSDELLDGGWTPLGELATFTYGQTAKAADSGDVRFIRITDISEQGKLRPNGAKYLPETEVNPVYQVERGDVLIARTGASFGKSVLIGGETGSYASFLIRLRFNEEKVLPQYFWHFAQSSLYWDQAERLVSRGGQPQFNANVLKSLRMPVPALHKQREVAMLLNSFDALVNDLTSGLPAEIEARRMQYEYYRDRLLAFEEVLA